MTRFKSNTDNQSEPDWFYGALKVISGPHPNQILISRQNLIDLSGSEYDIMSWLGSDPDNPSEPDWFYQALKVISGPD